MQREYDARKDGIEQGKEEGKELGKKEIALNLIERGLSLTEISTITGLSLDQLSKLVESNS